MKNDLSSEAGRVGLVVQGSVHGWSAFSSNKQGDYKQGDELHPKVIGSAYLELGRYR